MECFLKFEEEKLLIKKCINKKECGKKMSLVDPRLQLHYYASDQVTN